MSPCSQLRFCAPLERAVLLIVLAALSGCDVPTDLPIFDVRWVIPVEETSISVVELLPATGVIISGGNFVVDADTVFLNETLGSLCAACVDSGGFAVPKPVFDAVFTQTGNLATDVESVQLVSGSISLAIQNDLGFDPIRPAAGSPGTMTVTIYDVDASGRPLSQVTLDGNILTDSLPNGALTTILLNLAPGTVSTTIFAEVDLDFQWELDDYAYRPGEIIFDGTSISDDFDAVPATGAPGVLQDSVLAQSFDPVLILGTAYRVSEKLAVTADFRKDTGEALVLGNGSHVGLGVEFRAISVLALRGGMARAGGAGRFAVGFGLVLGPVNLSGAYLTETGPGDFKAASVALSFGHH